jgi:hypothetical protein
MAEIRILLDSNVYLRLANSFHPLLNKSFGQNEYCLYLILEFEKEFNKNPRLKNKFGWVNEPEYVENRNCHIQVRKIEKDQIQLTYSFLREHNVSQGLGASRVDVKALAYGYVLGAPIITDDVDMTKLGTAFGIEIWSLLDLLKIMLNTSRANSSNIKALLGYLEYMKDLPYPSFKQDVLKLLKINKEGHLR